jgi:large subunit ribosomal protein L30
MAENKETNAENTAPIKTVTVTLIKSPIRSRGTAKDTLVSLGLRHMRQSHTLPDNPAVRGMIDSVRDWVKVEE